MAMIGHAVSQQHVGNSLNQPRELGLIERASGVASGLKSLHSKIGDLRDRVEGNSQQDTQSGQTGPMPGLPSQLSESESILRSCHSLIDDLIGKF